MKKSGINNKKIKEFNFPTGMYSLIRFFYKHPKLTEKLNKWESKCLRKKIAKNTIDRPIYITALARAGTTIFLEMLSKHLDVGNHRYLHMVNPFIPHWIQKIANATPIFKKPVKRLHKDRIVVTRKSPEAVEEIFWQFYFEDIHNEETSNILNSNTENPEFEEFYKEHIKKLLINQNATRYFVKNNYNISRMEYLQKIFPDAKFLLVIRNPINHIASYMKQHRIFNEMERENKKLLLWTKIIGHREFGSARLCINLNNTKKIERIRELWKDEKTQVKGYATYWKSIYEYVTVLLQRNKKLAYATLIIRYEDLCDNPEKILDQLISHVELSSEKFSPIKREYSTKISRPNYYLPSFSDEELKDIEEITKEIAKKYDYF